MRWRGGRRSTNVEDRRGRAVSSGAKLGGGATLIVIVIALLLGKDPSELLSLVGGGTNTVQQPVNTQVNDEAADFVSVVLADTEDTWSALFSQRGGRYEPPRLVLFTDSVQSACGMSTAATGPFYCPGDRQVYIDLSFFRELHKLGAPGDFAQAYVLGHEIGHHLQTLLGTEREVRKAQRQASKKQSNALSVLMELQADCYAGVWAHHAHRQRNILEPGDLKEGLTAAASIGDDRLQRMAGRAVNPDAFTHGTSKQRVQWFKIGLDQGNVDKCNTFSQASR